jgi:N12 class adenine-specific DNA methylase
MIAAAMELKRLGLCHKSLIVVPNHLPAQWAAEAIRLYPNIRLLAPEKEHLSSSQRGELLSRIATSDYDAIIIPQTAFKMLPLNPEMVRDYIQREIDTLTEYLEEFESAGGKNKRSVKEIQRAIKKLRARLDDTNQQISNTIAEVYVCQKYLQLETLQELGLDHFDAWVQQFAETTQSLEMTPDGSGFRIYVAKPIMWRSGHQAYVYLSNHHSHAT